MSSEGRWGFRAFNTPLMRTILPWLGLLNLALWALKAPLWGQDAVAYWFAGRSLLLGQPVYYSVPTQGTVGSFFYSPPIAQVLALGGFLSFVPWIFIWSALLFLTLRWLAGSRWLASTLLLIPIIPFELQVGNIHLLLAAALALGLGRHPTWLAALPFTKLIPVSLVYRPHLAPLVAALTVSVISFVIAPSLWFDWWRLISGLQPVWGANVIPIPWIPRLIAAVALAAWARRLDKGPAVIVASFATWLTIPVMWINSSVILLAPLAVPASRAWLEKHAQGLVGARPNLVTSPDSGLVASPR
jgi:hypothetical protein